MYLCKAHDNILSKPGSANKAKAWKHSNATIARFKFAALNKSSKQNKLLSANQGRPGFAFKKLAVTDITNNTTVTYHALRLKASKVKIKTRYI